MKSVKWIIGVICSLFLMGCGPNLVEHKTLPDLQFDEMDEYQVNIDDIPKPEKINTRYLTKDYEVTTDVDKAAFVLLSPEEFAKIDALLDILIAYKGVINKQEYLVNTHVKIINTLREFLELERQKAQAYRDMWVDSENAYRQERHDRRIENALNKGVISLISVGSLIALILAL